MTGCLRTIRGMASTRVSRYSTIRIALFLRRTKGKGKRKDFAARA
jgi:hypothetical protein